jgi:UDPglucose--hexose-1-phosphate uridylyltransferase
VTAPELRIDPLSGLRVVLAPARADRPFSFESAAAHDAAREECPLCEGHESWTPPETYAVRPGGGPPDSPGWTVRAVPNKYPLLAPDSGSPPDDPLAGGRGDPELLVAGHATGEHEVIVHTPEHLASITELDAEQFARAGEAWRERSAAHAGAAYVHVMVNEGHAAGASLEHSHAQLYALDIVPALVARERERFTAHNTRTMGGCLLCDVLQEEVRRRERIVAIDDHAVLLAPFASREPYELQLVPRRHEPSFAQSDTAALALLYQGLLRLRDWLGDAPPLNLWVRTAPRGAEHFHWHVDVVPRLTRLAGFELGTGLYVNIVPPERAARELAEGVRS